MTFLRTTGAAAAIAVLVSVASCAKPPGGPADGPVRAEPPPAPDSAGWRSALDSTVAAELRDTWTPGAAVVIVQGDSVVYAAGFGVTSAETRAPMTPDVLFRIASTTKVLTAAAVLLAAERGSLSLDEPVRSYLAGLAPSIGRLTLRQLLSHQSGLRDESSYYGPGSEDALLGFVRSWSDSTTIGPPDDVYSYSNLNYALAGAVLERVGGRPYADVMRDDLFRPLGMGTSAFRLADAMTHPLSQGHDASAPGGSVAVVRPFSNDTRFWPAGSAFTSASELARFVIALLNEGRVAGAQALPEPVVEALLTRQATVPPVAPGEDAGYTYGLIERRTAYGQLLQHGGIRIGFGTVVRLLPEQRIGIIVLANRTGAVLMRTLDHATAALAPEARVPATAPPPPLPLDSAEAAAAAGRYVNGELDLELAAHGGRLELRATGASTGAPVTKVGPSQYVAGGTGFALVTGRTSGATYLFIAGRALRRVER